MPIEPLLRRDLKLPSLSEVARRSVERALRRRGLLQPVNYEAERRRGTGTWARREAFVDPPTHATGSAERDHPDAIAAIEVANGEVEARRGHSLLRDITDAAGIPHR